MFLIDFALGLLSRCLCRLLIFLQNHFFFFEKIFQKYDQCVKQLGSRSDPTFFPGLVWVQTVCKSCYMCLRSYLVALNHVRIQRGGGGRGPVPPFENHKKYRVFLAILVPIPLKSLSYQASFQFLTIIGTPAKRHLNGVSLTGRRWPAYTDIWIIPLPSN